MIPAGRDGRRAAGTADAPGGASTMTERPVHILELRSVRGTGGGPEKTILVGAARSDPRRFLITVCYIRDRRDEVYALDRLARELGVSYVEVPERHSFDPAIWGSLRRLVRERHIDIVHGHDYKSNLLALLLSRAEPVAPLATAHGWTGQSLRERWLYYPAERSLLSRFPRVIAVSSEIADRLVDAGVRRERITVVLNGIDAHTFRRDPARIEPTRASLGVSRSTLVAGSVGRLEQQKRFDLLIEAAARLRQQQRDVTVAIVGDGSLAEPLRAHARTHGIADACIFTGHRTDIVDVLHGFDLFVQSSEYEGTPNCVLEAMAVGVPVVATTVGGTAELIEDHVHGLLVPPHDVPALAAAMASALDNRQASEARASAARVRIEEELSFDARMRKVERIYKALVDQGTSAGARPAVA
jgi:glycosyltransferase involved in cell wall biosynthesis